MSPLGRSKSPGAREQELMKAEKQTKEEAVDPRHLIGEQYYPSINKDDSRRPTQDIDRQIGERLHRETAVAMGMQVFDNTRLTKILKEGKDVLVCQLWAEGGGPVWRQVQVLEDSCLLMMPVRKRTRRRSKVWSTEEMEKEEQTWQSKI